MIFAIRLAGEGEGPRSLATDRQIGGSGHDDCDRRCEERAVRFAKNGRARKGVEFEFSAVARDQRLMLLSIETREQHPARPRSDGVDDRRNLVNGLAFAKQRLIQANSRSTLKIDFEFRRHARECTKAPPLR